MEMRSLFLLVALTLWTVGAGGQSLPRWSDPILGGVRDVVFGGTDASVILAVRGGLDPIRSRDGGETWTPFTVQGTRPDRIVASPTDSNVFYALKDTPGSGTSLAKSALYRTDNGGESWYLIHGQLAPDVVLGDIVVGANPDLLYATRVDASICSILCIYTPGFEAHVSFDAGRTWRSVAGEQRIGGKLHPSASDTGVVYAAMGERIHRSTNAGANWRLVSPPLEATRYRSAYFTPRIVVDRVDPRVVYARMTNGTQLWVTEDGGETWAGRTSPNVPSPHRSVFADPVERGRAYFMGEEGELFETRDAARTWTPVAPRHDGPLASVDFGDESAPTAVAVKDGKRFVLAFAGHMGNFPAGRNLHRTQVADDSLALGSDLWWNPAQSGAGITMTQHASGQVFLVWCRYDANGDPVWQVMPGVSWSGARSFSGQLLETRGPPYFQGAFDTTRVSTAVVGSATVTFSDGDNAVFSYRLADGSAGEIAITRQVFGPANDFGPNQFADLWWSASESGWGLSVSHQFAKVFACWYVYDANGRPLWVVLPDGALDAGRAFQTGVQVYQGDLYTTRGPPFAATFDASKVVVTKVGTALIRYIDKDRISLSYTAFGKTESKELTRQPF